MKKYLMFLFAVCCMFISCSKDSKSGSVSLTKTPQAKVINPQDSSSSEGANTDGVPVTTGATTGDVPVSATGSAFTSAPANQLILTANIPVNIIISKVASTKFEFNVTFTLANGTSTIKQLSASKFSEIGTLDSKKLHAVIFISNFGYNSVIKFRVGDELAKLSDIAVDLGVDLLKDLTKVQVKAICFKVNKSYYEVETLKYTVL